MAITSCTTNFNLVDVEAKEDATLSVTGNADFAVLENLNEEELQLSDYGTLEWNYTVLDGTMPHLPDDLTEVGYPVFADTLTDETGETEETPAITINFGDNHSSAGISFGFIGDIPKTIRIVWYTESGQLADVTFEPDSTNYFCEYTADDYNKLEIYFSGSITPYRYIKLNNIEYGYELVYSGEAVKKGTVLEELDPISSQLSINTAEITLFDSNKNFNALNPSGKYALLRKKQKVLVTESYDGGNINMGTFYLDGWEGVDENQIKFSLIDGIGIIDKTKFKKGRIYVEETAETIVSEIMESANWTKYTLSDELKSITLSGYIPVCTHREALQQVAFALRAVVDCSRSNTIDIYRQNNSADLKINYDRQFLGTGTVSTREYVTEVDITIHSYSIADESSEAFDGTLQAGSNEVLFDKPFTNLTITGGTIEESSTNYAIVTMEEDGDCTITGYEYEDTTSTVIKKSTLSEHSGVVENVKTVSDATLVNKNNVYLLMEHLLDYYALVREATQKYLVNSERVGRWVNLKSQYNKFVSGGIESQTIDLTGGFIAEATVVGYATNDIDLMFTGKEIYTGEEIGVM